MREKLKAFKVLSDETKLRVLNLITERECCVCEVMQALEISQSKSSRCLSALYDAGFLKQRKEGLWSLYSIDEKNTRGFRARLIEAAKESLKDSRIAAQDKERLKLATRTGINCVQGTCLSNK